MNNIRSWFVFLLLMIPVMPVFSHVKWFSKEGAVKAPIEQIVSPLFIGLSLLIAIILGVLPQFIPFIMKLKWASIIEQKLSELHRFTPILLRVGTATSLLLQITSGSILAPEIPLTSFSFWVSIVVIVALLSPLRITASFSALGILILVAESTLRFGWFHMLDYFFYIAIAFALSVQKTKYEDLGTPALYLGTGIALCWVAVEKWVYPGMSANIITHHNIPTFGFDPSTFIVLTAFIEFVVGYLLIVGLLNRLLAVVLTLIFITTTMVFGWVEVVGHFIVHIVLLIFIIEGTGFYNPPVQMHTRRMDQVIFVSLNFLFILASILLVYFRFA